jgi:hypothetical protein
MYEPTVVHDSAADQIHGYDFARPGAAHSPVSLEEMRQLEETVGWSEEDAQVLQRHGRFSGIMRNRWLTLGRLQSLHSRTS